MNKLDNFTKKYFKKFVVGGSITIVTLLCVLMLLVNTDVVSAVSSSWKDKTLNKATNDIAVTGQNTVDELLAKGVDNTITEHDLDEYIKQQEALLDKTLREYYEAKLNKLTSDYDLEILKAQIKSIRENLSVDYKAKIDLAFVGMN